MNHQITKYYRTLSWKKIPSKRQADTRKVLRKVLFEKFLSRYRNELKYFHEIDIQMKLKPLDNWCHLLEYLACVVLSLHMLSMTRKKITCPSLDRNFSKHPILKKNSLS